jgi:hypothetical protein
MWTLRCLPKIGYACPGCSQFIQSQRREKQHLREYRHGGYVQWKHGKDDSGPKDIPNDTIARALRHMDISAPFIPTVKPRLLAFSLSRIRKPRQRS